MIQRLIELFQVNFQIISEDNCPYFRAGANYSNPSASLGWQFAAEIVTRPHLQDKTTGEQSFFPKSVIHK